MKTNAETADRVRRCALLGVRRRIANGSAIIEDDGIGVRVICNPDGSGNAESTMARRESMMCHADRIDAMIAEAMVMLSTPNDRTERPEAK